MRYTSHLLFSCEAAMTSVLSAKKTDDCSSPVHILFLKTRIDSRSQIGEAFFSLKHSA